MSISDNVDLAAMGKPYTGNGIETEKLYLCNPSLHTSCKKTLYQKKDGCRFTNNIKYAKVLIDPDTGEKVRVIIPDMVNIGNVDIEGNLKFDEEILNEYKEKKTEEGE